MTELALTIMYMTHAPEVFGTTEHEYIFDVSSESIGTVGAGVNFLVAAVVSNLTSLPPKRL